MARDKVLIIAYYWPPSGGAGVQRWVKMSKYLSKMGVDVHVLTVDEKCASYSYIDSSLTADIDSTISIHKTKSLEILNLYSKIVGEGNMPKAGTVGGKSSIIGQGVVALRSNLFIPDPRKGWNRYAYSRAKEIIEEHNIDTVITTSPPHSTQLIGLKLKRNLGINWIADMRDPWTDIYYYSKLKHSPISRYIDRRLERAVLTSADKIITVGKTLKQLFLDKYKGVSSLDVTVITNGYDSVDFEGITKSKSDKFRICYTGTMSDQYSPGLFFQALSTIDKRYSDIPIEIDIVGTIPQSVKEELDIYGLEINYIETVPHSRVIEYQVDADMLLLVIPKVESANLILTGKMFEYLASGNPIVSIGPKDGDAADIIEECSAGETFSRDDLSDIITYLDKVVTVWSRGERSISNRESIANYSRERQAEQLYQLLDTIW